MKGVSSLTADIGRTLAARGSKSGHAGIVWQRKDHRYGGKNFALASLLRSSYVRQMVL